MSGAALVDVLLVEVMDDGPLGWPAARALLGAQAVTASDNRQAEDVRRSVVARAALARLVGARTRTDPADVAISHDERGAPFLPDSPRLYVSISHASGFTACALSRGRVGVDIERSDRGEADDELARRVCAAGELRALERLPPDARARELIRLWSRKEALAKALGLGLGVSLAQLDVSHDIPLIGGVRERDLRVRDLDQRPAGYTVALATEGRWRRIRTNVVKKP